MIARQSLSQLQDLSDEGHLAGDDAALCLRIPSHLFQLVALVVLADPDPCLAFLRHKTAAQVGPAFAHLRQQSLIPAEHDLKHIEDLLQVEPFCHILQSAYIILKVHEFFPGSTLVLTC